MPDIRQRAQDQFGAHAADYVASDIHARGGSLARLVEMVPEGRYRRLLDVATGGGHTAAALSPLADEMVIGDLTHPMLRAARPHLGELGPHACQHDAEALPFVASSFDLVSCRIAAHHFPDVGRFVREVARVLQPSGVFALVDNVVSGTPKVGAWLNTFEKLRDPSHHLCYTIDDWATFFFQAGLAVLHSEIMWKRLAFAPWVERTGVSTADRTRLRLMLEQPPAPVAEWLQPRQEGGAWSFRIAEVVLVGRLN